MSPFHAAGVVGEVDGDDDDENDSDNGYGDGSFEGADEFSEIS